MNDSLIVWTSCFMLLFALVAIALIWMHVAIRIMERQKIPQLGRSHIVDPNKLAIDGHTIQACHSLSPPDKRLLICLFPAQTVS
jgi:hypothetical protein